MPAKEIKELRKSGKLEEALKMALEELNEDPENIWPKRNISWVYYEYVKKHALNSDFDGFYDNLLHIKELSLAEDDVMIFDVLTWQISSMVFKLNKAEVVDFSKINQVFDCIKEFHFTKPSEGYSLLYKSFHKGYKTWSRYLDFADWWDFENLTEEDYQEEEYDGRAIMALAEQAFIAYSKKLLEGESLDPFGAQKKINKDKVNEFLPKLDAVITQNNFQYPIYFKTKLLLVLDKNEEALTSFLPFAKQKKNDFWVWELLAEIFHDNKENKIACLSKALSLKTSEDFLIKTRQKLATLLIEEKLYNEAKFEIVSIIKTRENKGWKTPTLVSNWTKESWYFAAKMNDNNSSFYKTRISIAEELLFSDVKEVLIFVDFVNKDKKMLNFINSKTLKGFCKYNNLAIRPKIGDGYIVRLDPIGDEGFYKILSIKKADINSDEYSDVIKETSGSINIPEGKSFGFLDNIFVTPDLVGKNKIQNGEHVTVKAIMSFNKSKNEWGWKAFKVRFKTNFTN